MDVRSLVSFFTWIIRFYITAELCCAAAVHMTCSQTGDLGTYTVLNRSSSDGCFYEYRNATKYVIAHNDGCERALVLNNSLDGLVTSKCIGVVFFDATCNKGKHYSANCTVACAEDLHSKETSDVTFIVIAAVLLAAVVIVVIVVIVVCKLKHRYAPVKESDIMLAPQP